MPSPLSTEVKESLETSREGRSVSRRVPYCLKITFTFCTEEDPNVPYVGLMLG